jgi:hypothetical protein
VERLLLVQMGVPSEVKPEVNLYEGHRHYRPAAHHSDLG